MSATGPRTATSRSRYVQRMLSAFGAGLYKAFNANKTSWVGLGLFLVVCVAGALRALDRALRPDRPESILVPSQTAVRRALVRHRLLRPRHALAHPLRRRASRSPSASCRSASALVVGSADRHDRRILRRRGGHRPHADHGRVPRVPDADPRPLHRRDARGRRWRTSSSPSPSPRSPVRADRTGAHHLHEGARVRRGRAGAGLLRPPADHRRHILPNILPEILVMGSLWMATAIRVEASLAFIGLGVAPPTPTWGGMIREGFENILDSFWLAVVPVARDPLVGLLAEPPGRRTARRHRPASERRRMSSPQRRRPLRRLPQRGPLDHRGQRRVVPHRRQGETVAVVGESGSGKSVTALPSCASCHRAGRASRGRRVCSRDAT